ncbi:MAG TPA: NAD(P)/FAD-dependent oxidoreductase [Bacteroidia bacterium]|nr:NAD(P)/FAD-dependent oxidoreductase [Bacteroidia bacterium]HNU33136.1 NAD(P)/FAD-dependent oxidoreductase [Bacteroidia bacterium]
MKNVAVIGGGAAGFFAAIHAAQNGNEVTIFEKGNSLLNKVRISGGGRCNVTHACFEVNDLVKFYPRGSKELISAFYRFNTNHTIDWFESRGVELKTEGDGRMFPVSDLSQTIIDCLLKEAKRNGVKIKTQCGVNAVILVDSKLILKFANDAQKEFDSVIVTSGGYPSSKNYDWLRGLGINIVEPVPSLFTFNIPNSPLKGLEGVSVSDALVTVEDSKFKYNGPLLITHWGISGPAVLKTSAFAARFIHDLNYNFTASINFIPSFSAIELEELFNQQKKNHPSKKVFSKLFPQLPGRLWERLCAAAGITEGCQYANISKQQMLSLIKNILSYELRVKGKTTFKEEFVTCGGIDLKEVDMKTMESKKIPGLFFAGEVLNIDGVTGGFNFQAAWTTGFIAGSSV